MKALHFDIECDEITSRQREMIHIYIRKILERNNKHLVMKGIWPVGNNLK